jgi:hypothetical protein
MIQPLVDLLIPQFLDLALQLGGESGIEGHVSKRV